MPPRLAVSTLALSILLLGCSVPHPPLLEGALQPLAAPVPQPSPARWWTALHDPQLDRLVESALANNFTLKAAALRLDEARSLETGTVLQHVLPKAGVEDKEARSATKTYSSNNPFARPAPGELPVNTASFQASWEMPLFGRAQAWDAYAKAQTRQGYWQREAAGLAVEAEVVRTYAQWQGVARSIALTRDDVGLAHQGEAAEERLATAGLSTTAEVDQRHGDVLDLQAKQEDLNRQQQVLEHRLAVLSGTPTPPALFPPPEALPPVPLVDHVLAGSLRYRPDVRVAEQAVTLAAAQYGIARADLWPQFTLAGDLSMTHGTLDSTGFTRGVTSVASFSSGVRIPLLDWFSLKATANAKAKDLAASVQDYRQTVLAAWEEAENAFGEYLAAQARERLALEQTAMARHEVRRQAELARLGVGARQQVLRAHRTLNDKQEAALTERFNALQAWAKLQKATFVSEEPPQAPSGAATLRDTQSHH